MIKSSTLKPRNDDARKIKEIIELYEELINDVTNSLSAAGCSQKEIDDCYDIQNAKSRIKVLTSDYKITQADPNSFEGICTDGYFDTQLSAYQSDKTNAENTIINIVSSQKD